jgi:hypothetical protein
MPLAPAGLLGADLTGADRHQPADHAASIDHPDLGDPLLVAVDIDDTIDAFPQELRAICTSLIAAGHTVDIVTGTHDEQPTQADCKAKADFLKSLGFAEGVAWSHIVVLPPPHDENKADWLAANHADILIDNSKANAKAAKSVCLVLVPWQTRS